MKLISALLYFLGDFQPLSNMINSTMISVFSKGMDKQMDRQKHCIRLQEPRVKIRLLQILYSKELRRFDIYS